MKRWAAVYGANWVKALTVGVMPEPQLAENENAPSRKSMTQYKPINF
jgi:hypothetical protein